MSGPKMSGPMAIMLKQFGFDPEKVMGSVQTVVKAVEQIDTRLQRIEEAQARIEALLRGEDVGRAKRISAGAN